jgi:AraC family transcriptional regulator of arabinose operon
MLVLPAPRVREALLRPGTSHLLVTDCGYFPEARSHARTRSRSIDEAVIIVCAKGSGWCRTPSGTFPVGAGEVMILPPGIPHAYGADESDPWTLWWVHVAGARLPELLAEAGMTAEAPVRELSDVFAAVSLIGEVLEWMERDSTTRSLLAAGGAAWHLVTLLASDRPAGDERGTRIDRAAKYLRDHPAERIEVAELAAMVRLSPSHFATLFKQRLGYPVLQYQTQLRMAHARQLLDTTDKPIPEVAAASGYPDGLYFSRQFKRIHGITPNRYRHRDPAS